MNLINIVQQVSRTWQRKGLPEMVEVEDIEQEGMRIALAAAMKVEADKNGPGYVYRAVSRELGNYVAKQIAVPNVTGDWENARNFQQRVDPDDALLIAEDESPEELVLEREGQSRMARWRIELRRELMGEFSEEDLAIVDRLYGLDGFPSANTPARVCEQLGVPAWKVYKVTRRIKKLGETIGVYNLKQQYEDIRR